MNQTYVFSDWTSVSLMKSQINPSFKIDVGCMLASVDDSDSLKKEGYRLTIYDKTTKEIYYRFYVDYFNDSAWSLDTQEAVKVLNKLGFFCEYREEEIIQLPEESLVVLQALKTLGYTHLWRIDSDVYAGRVFKGDPLVSRKVSEVVPKFNSHLFKFLTTTPISINSLLPVITEEF